MMETLNGEKIWEFPRVLMAIHPHLLIFEKLLSYSMTARKKYYCQVLTLKVVIRSGKH